MARRMVKSAAWGTVLILMSAAAGCNSDPLMWVADHPPLTLPRLSSADGDRIPGDDARLATSAGPVHALDGVTPLR
ncbi:MAG: hypothetical protein WD042_11575 [Phycisphaeraceae bacterium]